jgi:serine/threonine-protein kinase
LVKVVDFGIAMLQDPIAEGAGRLTGTGVVVGTANYMSPEHCRGAHVDARSDIYALGVVAYEMLTGRVPFAAPLPSAVIVAHVNEPPPPPHLLRPDLPPAVERVVLAALAKLPEERPQTAGELARRFAAAARGEVVTSEATRPVRPAAARTTDSTPPAPTDPTRRAIAEPPLPPTAHTGAPAARRGLSPLAVALIAIVMAAIGAAIAAAAFGIVNWRTAENENRAAQAPPAPAPVPANTNASLDPTPAPPPIPKTNANVAPPPQPAPGPNENTAPPPAPAPSPAPAGSRPLDQNEENAVDAFLSDWLASVRARDIGWHIRHYADVVDYYTAGPVPRFRVRADRARAFARFDTIEMRITAVREATISADGREVRLVIDKQWRFTGPDGESTGKVKQLLVLRRIGDDFKIVVERDLAVY